MLSVLKLAITAVVFLIFTFLLTTFTWIRFGMTKPGLTSWEFAILTLVLLPVVLLSGYRLAANGRRCFEESMASTKTASLVALEAVSTVIQLFACFFFSTGFITLISDFGPDEAIEKSFHSLVQIGLIGLIAYLSHTIVYVKAVPKRLIVVGGMAMFMPLLWSPWSMNPNGILFTSIFFIVVCTSVLSDTRENHVSCTVDLLTLTALYGAAVLLILR